MFYPLFSRCFDVTKKHSRKYKKVTLSSVAGACGNIYDDMKSGYNGVFHRSGDAETVGRCLKQNGPEDASSDVFCYLNRWVGGGGISRDGSVV